MKVEKLLRRLKIEFVKVNLIQSSLDAILFFLTVNLVFFLFSIQIVDSVHNYLIFGISSVIFFAGDLVYRIRTYHLELYEEKNPELREVLRTARDNLDKSNTVSEALFNELMDRARTVTSESIIPSRTIIKKILAIGLMCFLTVGSGLVDFQLKNSTSSILSDLDFKGSTPNAVNDTETLNGSKILGKASNIKIDARELEFRISGTGKSSESRFRFEAAGKNISFQSVDDRSAEDLELAKKYSLAVKDFS
ncbi:MAG: hypothetical protein ABEK10_03820 [Candidatus Nanosalina sp.]